MIEYKFVYGYIRTAVLSDDDYSDMINEMKKMDFCFEEKDEESTIRRIYYQADLALLKYYSNYPKKVSSQYKEKINIKLRYLFEKLITAYPENYFSEDIKEFNLLFEVPPGYILRNFYKALIKSGYPHQVLIFCFRALIDYWSIDRIIKDLSEENLDNCYNLFINEYSEQSGLPTFLISLFFLEMNNKLNKKFKDNIHKKDKATMLRFEDKLELITGSTILHFYYSINKFHDISDWCNKIKRKTIKNLIKIMGN